MKKMEYLRRKGINDITSMVKLVSLAFCGIIIYSNYYVKYNMMIVTRNGQSIILGAVLFVVMLALIYGLWSFLVVGKFRLKHVKIIQIGENILFLIIFTSLIMLSNSYESQYKFLFLFLIITSTMQLGIKYGLTVAFASSSLISGMDLIFAPRMPVNIYFQNDLILMGTFILIAWSLGHYVEIENENIRQRDIRLDKLSVELEDRDRLHAHMEKMFIKNQACYDILIKNSHDAVFVHLDGKLMFANDSALALSGFSCMEDLYGKSIMDMISDEEKDQVNEKFQEIYDEKETMICFQGKVLRNTGESIYVENTSAPFLFDGKPAVLSIFHNITPEKEVEKLQLDVERNVQLLNESKEINRFITEFFSNISHELKTPLNVIYAAIQVLMMNNNLPEEYMQRHRRYLNMIKQNCYRLTRLINNLLDMTRIDSGFLRPQLQNHNIVNVVEDIVQSIASYVESKGMTLIFDTDVEEKIMAIDADKLERIILNLLSNSIKFTNPGGEIFVNVFDKEDKVVISVKDTGVGIPKDKLKVIFERFGQVDKTLRRNREGTGIGLSLVKSFVEMHGGSVNIISEPDKGSEFIITLPVFLLEDEKQEDNLIYETNIERINIEFSDIYSDFSIA